MFTHNQRKRGISDNNAAWSRGELEASPPARSTRSSRSLPSHSLGRLRHARRLLPNVNLRGERPILITLKEIRKNTYMQTNNACRLFSTANIGSCLSRSRSLQANGAAVEWRSSCSVKGGPHRRRGDREARSAILFRWPEGYAPDGRSDSLGAAGERPRFR